MSTVHATFKTGDVYPTVRETIRQGADPLDLTGATVTVAARSRADGTVLFDDKPVTIENATEGLVAWNPSTTDTANAGTFLYHYTVNFGGDNDGSVPNEGYYLFVVEPRIESE